MHHNFRPDSACYSYYVIGFPKIQLKWQELGIKVEDPYITVKGIIKPWSWERGHGGSVDFRKEIPRFEEWVRDNFSKDPTVQG